jgi:hypothetical protein
MPPLFSFAIFIDVFSPLDLDSRNEPKLARVQYSGALGFCPAGCGVAAD